MINPINNVSFTSNYQKKPIKYLKNEKNNFYNNPKKIVEKDIKKPEKNSKLDIIESIAICAMGLSALIAGAFIAFNRSDFFGKNPAIEKSINITKDSIQNVAKDTLQLIKK